MFDTLYKAQYKLIQYIITLSVIWCNQHFVLTYLLKPHLYIKIMYITQSNLGIDLIEL